MSEAETWTSPVFPHLTNSVDSTQVEQANQLFSVIPEQQLTKAETTDSILTNLLKSSVEINSVKSETISPWVDVENSLSAIPNHASALALSELFKLIGLIQEMRAANGSLTKQVMQLEQALAESQSSEHLQKQQLQTTVSQLAQATDELAEAQAQVTSLSQALATAEQTAQTWQQQVTVISSQFESSQERIAQMERECATTQANCIEKSHQLQQSETTCRELRTRLARQQRQTLQLKVALEKCLEAPAPSYTNNYNFSSTYEPAGYWTSSGEESSLMSRSEALLPKAQPIPPWSAPDLELNSRESTAEFGYDWTTIDNTELTPPIEQGLEQAIATPAIDLPQFTPEPAAPSSETEASWQELYEQLLADSVPAATKEPTAELPKLDSDRPLSHSWPAPVVYPYHPPKGRKSLAAIELPTFGLNRVDRNARAV